jgi:hypothetical protein
MTPASLEIPVGERLKAPAPMGIVPVTMAERELLEFINSVTDLFGPDQTKVLDRDLA